MLRPDLKDIKIKRILLVYRELERMKMNHESSMETMEYMFNLGARWMEEILRNNSIEQYSHIRLEHEDIDLAMVDMVVKKMHAQARKERSKQMNMFNQINS